LHAAQRVADPLRGLCIQEGQIDLTVPPSLLAIADEVIEYAALAHGRSWQILLQKSFCTGDQKFSRP
jgi:hypothetical protein